jgi:hypothetical protein
LIKVIGLVALSQVTVNRTSVRKRGCRNTRPLKEISDKRHI